MSRFSLLAVMAAIVVLGCSTKKAPPAPVYPVTGKVTYKGQPVVGADITFGNDAESRSAFGRTDENGKYRLTTFSANDGAVAGKHVVTIVKNAPPAAVPVLPDVESPDYAPPGLGEDTLPAPPKSDFPEKYGDPQKSGLIAVVNADAPNDDINFELTD